LDRDIIEIGESRKGSDDDLDTILGSLDDEEDEEDLKEEEEEGSLDEFIEDLEDELELEEEVEEEELELEEEEEEEEEEEKVEEEEETDFETEDGSLDETLAELEDELELDLEEEKVEEEQVEEGLKKDLRTAFEEAELKLSDLEQHAASTVFLEGLIAEAEELREESRYDEALDKAQEASDFGEEVQRFLDKLNTLEEKITGLKKRGSDVAPLEEAVEEAQEYIKKGTSEKAFSTLEKAIRRAERKRKEGRLDTKERINQTIKDLSEILEVGKRFELSLNQIRDIISTALELSREGKVDRALRKLEFARERASEIIGKEMDDAIYELEEEAESTFDERRIKEIKEYIEKVRGAKERGDFKEAHKAIQECRRGASKSDLKIGSMDVDEIIKIKELSETVGIDCSDAEEFLSLAREAYRKGSEIECKRNLKKAKQILLKNISRDLQKIMKNGMKKLEKAKRKGEEISKPVSHLKQANLLMKKKQFVKALEHVKEFKGAIDELDEDEEVLSTTVSSVEKKKSPETKIDRSQNKAKKRKKMDERRSSPPSKRTTNIRVSKEGALDLGVDDLYGGSTNLLKVKDLSEAYDVFKTLISRTGSGLCVTRDYPKKVKKKYDLDEFSLVETDSKKSKDEDLPFSYRLLEDGKKAASSEDCYLSMIWLTNVDREGAVKPKDLERLSLKLESFITKGKGVILLNGLEYLVSNNSFKTVLHLIQSLKDQVAIEDSIFIITVSPDTFSRTRMHQLEREVDEVFP